MTYEGAWLWLCFLAIGLATTLPRASFIVLGSRVSLPPALERALRYAPAAALAALIAPELLLGQNAAPAVGPELAAGVTAGFAAWRFRNPWLPFIAGMGVLWLLRALL